MLEQCLMDRISRDISDGLIVLDMNGSISFINPSAGKMLEVGDIRRSDNAVSVMQEDFKQDNDEFFQFLLNAVYERDKTHTGEVSFDTRQGHKKWFSVSTSFLYGEDGVTQEGVLVRLVDITDIRALRQKTYDSAFVFVLMMAGVCLWSFVYLIWKGLGAPIADTVMTKVVEFFGILAFYILWKYTSITVRDMGLSVKGAGGYIRKDLLYTLAAAGILVVIKLVLLKLAPSLFARRVLVDFSGWDWSCTLYPVTVVTQEFLTRGVIHESVNRIMPGKYSDFWAILVSSLFFGALHIHKGIVFMVGAFILLSVFGLIYRKQKTIWGLCIPHYVLGLMVDLMF